jgi:hypothetical protein
VVQRGWRSGQATRTTYSRSAPPDQSARSARRARPLKRTALLAKPVNGINAPQRPDCVAGHVRFELRNVVANYPFEKSRRFGGIQPNFGHGDHSRLSAVRRVRSSGPVARISAGVLRPSICIAEMMRELARDFCRSKDDPPAAKPATPLRSADAQPGHQTATNLHQTCVLLMKVRCNVHV